MNYSMFFINKFRTFCTYFLCFPQKNVQNIFQDLRWFKLNKSYMRDFMVCGERNDIKWIFTKTRTSFA